jgi:hypothetical protein
LYLNVYQPRVQTERGVAAFFRFHRGETLASTALMDPISKSFIAAVEHFVDQEQIPLITFTEGQRKDDIAQQQHAQFHRPEGIVFVGKAQEKTPVFRTEKRRNPQTGKKYPWIVGSTTMVNHFYFYGLDEDFGPPDSGPTALGARLLRGGDPRELGSRAARPRAVDFRSSSHETDAGAVPHPRSHRRSDAVVVHRLQTFTDQAIS